MKGKRAEAVARARNTKKCLLLVLEVSAPILLRVQWCRRVGRKPAAAGNR